MKEGESIRQYVLEERIHIGEVCDIWRARDKNLDRLVAVREIHPDIWGYWMSEERTRKISREGRIQRYFQSAQEWARLWHPHIARVQDVFSIEQWPYVVTEYIRGSSLENLLKERGALPEDEALRISGDILSALEYAHQRGVVHRDIRPSSILVEETGRILVDPPTPVWLGKERVTGVADMGALPYISPEEIGGEVIDNRTDVYCFGCILYEMLTGQPPFVSEKRDGSAELEIIRRKMNEGATPARAIRPAVSRQADRAVMKALAKQPGERFQSCEEMKSALAVEERTRELAERSPPRSAQFTGPSSIFWISAAALVGISVFLTIQILQYPPSLEIIEADMGKIHGVYRQGLDLIKQSLSPRNLIYSGVLVCAIAAIISGIRKLLEWLSVIQILKQLKRPE